MLDTVIGAPMLLKIIAGYLLVGLLFLLVFEAATKRISKKWDKNIANAMEAGFSAGLPMSRMWAVSVLFGALFLFWPAVIVGAVQDLGDGDSDSDNSKDKNNGGVNGTKR